MSTKTFFISGMSCNHCINAVKIELQNAGYNNFQIEIGKLVIQIDGFNDEIEKIKSAVSEAGFKIEKIE